MVAHDDGMLTRIRSWKGAAALILWSYVLTMWLSIGGYFAGPLGWVLVVAGLAIVIGGAVLFLARRETSPENVRTVLRKAQR